MAIQAHHNAGLPRHIGFILDGNRRWAKEKGLPKLVGHKKGYENLKTISQACFDKGIEVVSAYIFSTENWNREADEVDYLMGLALKLFKTDLEELMQKNIKVVVSGSRDKLAANILEAMDETISKTKDNTSGIINVCFNYGGQADIVSAVAAIIKNKVDPSKITPQLIRSELSHPELPPVDYIVRTSGEQRLSNFLLWDSAYAELEFVDVHWPGFKLQDLEAVLEEYKPRKRRFGS
jgi:undecaprenyl diphosphate synthase